MGVESESTIRKHRLFTMSTNSVNGHDEGHEEADVLEVEEDGGGLDVVNVSTEDAAFDEVVGCIEDIVVGTQFQNLQKTLLEDHCHHFESGEENKLVYTKVFEEYTDAIERLIESELERRVPGFDMEAFLFELAGRREELDGDVFEMLFTLTDFAAFKDLFVSFREMRESGRSAGLEEAIF